jgi:plastocyanin
MTIPTSDHPRAMRWFVAGVCALVLAGCASDDGAPDDAPVPAADGTADEPDVTDEPDATDEPVTTDEPEAVEAQEPAEAGAGTEVLLLDEDGFVFEPAEIAVTTGETVTWVHDGRISHTVTGDGFASGTLAAGDTFEVTFDEPGSFAYVCDFHGSMRGTVTVE